MDRCYICIDLKSFYASCEASDRNYDPLKTNLVVADNSRTEKTICLAVSPSLKSYGIPGRARLFEVIQRVKEVNADRFKKAVRLGVLLRDEDGRYHFTGSSSDANELSSDPSLELSYIIAPPRMKLYEKISTQIFSIYLKYISADDIHVYSIDECFMDVTGYLNTYHLTAHELAMKMIQDVLKNTGITATAGIGTNMYLAKIAMDVEAKHVPADEQGVRIAELNEMSYREKLWCHTPLTDFWRIGRGIARRLESIGCFTMGDIARQSVRDESVLYDLMGINAELLIDHAWGYEPADIATIKSYKPKNKSISSGQVLSEPYPIEKGKLIVREMTDLLALDLVSKNMATRQITLTLGYDRSSIRYDYHGRTIADSTFTVTKTGKRYRGKVSNDWYGRICPQHAHGTGNLDHWTSSTKLITEAMMELFDRITDPDLFIRRVTITANDIIPEDEIPAPVPVQMDLFTDYAALEKEQQERTAAEEKEKRLQKATLALKERFGKNIILKGMNLMDGATTIQRNQQIGGHRAGNDENES